MSGPVRFVARQIESLIGGALVLAALLLFLTGMILRMASSPLSGGWVEEVTIYLVAWGLLLSAAGCVANREHVRADFFLRILKPRQRRVADILGSAFGLCFCAALTWFGWETVQFALMLDERGPSYLQIPKAWFYAAMPVSMFACSLRYLLEIISMVRNADPPAADPA